MRVRALLLIGAMALGITAWATDEAFRDWQGALDAGLTAATLDTVEVDSTGDTAVEVGRYTLRAKGGQVADAGTYVVVWKREGGGWKLHRDIWNTNRPAPSDPTHYLDDNI